MNSGTSSGRALRCSQTDNQLPPAEGVATNGVQLNEHSVRAGSASNDEANTLDKIWTANFRVRQPVADKWRRPQQSPIDPTTQDIIFQFIDCDVYTTNEPVDNKTVVRLYGVSEKGNSVMALIGGYVVSFYIRKPSAFNFEECKDELVDKLNCAVASNCTSASRGHQTDGLKCVLSCTLEKRRSIYGFTAGSEEDFLKINISSPKYLGPARKLLESGFCLASSCPFQAFETFNSNIDMEVRCLADLGLTCCGWLTAPAGKYKLLGSKSKSIDSKRTRISRCQIEISIEHRDLVSMPCEGEWMKIAPLRVLSFDIECDNQKGMLPDAKRHSAIQIANMVQTYGQHSEPQIRNVFTLNTCSKILGSDVLSFDREEHMLDIWAEFFVNTFSC